MNDLTPHHGTGATPNTEAADSLAAKHRRHFAVMQQDAASAFLWTECAVKIAPATLRKLRCVGGGPPFFKGYGGRVFYESGALEAWGSTQRGPLVNSTSELPSSAS